MRIVQSYLLPEGYKLSELTVKSLLASAIQWKSVFPEDILCFYSSEEGCANLQEFCIQFGTCPWSQFFPTIHYGTLTSTWYDASRFLTVQQQETAFLFLDLDAFVFRDSSHFDELLYVRQELLESKEEMLGYQWKTRAIDCPHRFVARESLPIALFEAVPELQIMDNNSYETINSGVLAATPKIGKKIAESVLEAYRFLCKQYSLNIHEFVSGSIPWLIGHSQNTTMINVPETAIVHCCGLTPPGMSELVRSSRRKKLYERMCDYIISKREISYATLQKNLKTNFIQIV